MSSINELKGDIKQPVSLDRDVLNNFDTVLFHKIREWSVKKGIMQQANESKQFLKLMEEVGELSSAVQKNDIDEFKDAIGDCVIVLTILSQMKSIKIEDCINEAYSVIRNRTGKMVDGIFVKDN